MLFSITFFPSILDIFALNKMISIQALLCFWNNPTSIMYSFILKHIVIYKAKCLWTGCNYCNKIVCTYLICYFLLVDCCFEMYYLLRIQD